ncbi:30S ribosomal protein S3 chloroplastic [Dissostichus eleginoides]|uniref:30S ribosomal protein S3 chloroplastic n=1 Tax=Dissostichus eleginoides TaxID=100907 RepID=A0AAD9CJB7_DISEL|nr:30S ribosomal protein S3 chloroplastic [Dissostichus eleginoides]
MGGGPSHEDLMTYAVELYQKRSDDQCFLPDVGIDESLLKYSGTDSNTALQAYSNEMVNLVPGFISSLGSALGAFTAVPNALGLGALLISMIMELALKGTGEQSESSYSMLRRVFGEEKASSVRDTLSECLRRHRMFIQNEDRLKGELRRLEQQLSNHLTILKNSLLLDQQMSTRGFKIWVNGAAFHVQMLIHEARLNIETGSSDSDYFNAIQVAINLYLLDLDHLLDKYKTYKTSTTAYRGAILCKRNDPDVDICVAGYCAILNDEKKCSYYIDDGSLCQGAALIEPYLDYVFSNYEPILGLKRHFSDMKNNLNTLIHQHGSYILPFSTRGTRM